MFRDNYTDFSFNDLHSENFKVWITNNHDLKHNMTPKFKDQFNTPTYGQFRYYEGSTIENQDITLNCVALNITAEEWRAITEWLSPLTIGKLRFSWNPKYYYMVKISKNIVGEQWVLNKVDPILGELYHVTFTIDFTTTQDWAALGENNEDIVVRSVSNGYEKDSLDDITSAAEGDIYYIQDQNKYYICNETYADGFDTSYWTELSYSDSIFNNGYYMPSIISLPRVCEKQLPAQSHIWGSQYTKFIIKQDQGDFKMSVFNLRFQKIGAISYTSSDKKLTYSHYLTPNSNSYWDEVLRLEYYNTDLNELYFTVHSQATELIVLDQIGFAPKVIQSEVCNADYVCLCNNAGAYDTYPQIYSTIPYALFDNSNQYCSFKYNGIQPFSYYTALNSYNQTLTSYGIPIDILVNNVGIPIYREIQNSKQLVIPSGRPQLLKTIVKSVSDKTTYKNYEDLYYFTIELCLNSKPVYDRYRPYTCCLFTEIQSSNNYDNDIYGTQKYSASLDPDKFIVYNTPYIEYEKTNQGWIMRLTVPSYSLMGNLDLTTLSNNSCIYISLCDSFALGFTVDDNLNGSTSISLRARDVI